MTRYKGKIEFKSELKTAKNLSQFLVFTIDRKNWNCFDPIVNQDFHVGDYVEFETEKKGEFENLIPSTMKFIDAPLNNAPAKSAESNRKTGDSERGFETSGGTLQPELKNGWKNETTCKNINENPDSLEIGTPGRGGALKIYGNFDEPETFIIKFTNAKKVRDEANKLFSEEPK